MNNNIRCGMWLNKLLTGELRHRMRTKGSAAGRAEDLEYSVTPLREGRRAHLFQSLHAMLFLLVACEGIVVR